MLYWFFGFPGAGKTYVAGLFSRTTGIPGYDGDDFHTEDDRRAVEAGTFTLAHRHAQLERIHLAIRTAGISDALVTHPLPDKASRELVRGLSGHAARLIHVTAPLTLVKERLATRTDHHFSARLLDAWIPRHWEEPKNEDRFVIENGPDDDLLQEQLRKLHLWSHDSGAPVS